MDVFDKFFQKYSYKFPKGYPDMNDPNDVLLLENLLEKLGVNLKEEEPQSTNFEEFINKKNIKPEFKKQIIDNLSETQKAIILKDKSDDITKIINLLNDNPDISALLTEIREKSTGKGNMGPGEIAIITCSNSAEKAKDVGDIELNGKIYELKAGKDIKAGGTYSPSITRLTTLLWNLKQDIFEGDNKEQYKKILGLELFEDWKNLGKMQLNKEGDIDFTSIGQGKLTAIRSLFEKLKNKIKQISDEDTSKPNVISVGSKDFEISKDELTKISNTEPGKNITLTGKVILAKDSEKTLNDLRINLKLLLSSKILTSNEIDLDDAIKREFIKNIDGLINIINNKYTLYNQQEFIDKWEFVAIKQGNRPIFTLKGTQIDENEYED